MRLFTAVLFLMAMANGILAQSSGVKSPPVGQDARIQGTVTDGSGAVVPGAKVTAIRVDGQAYETASDQTGRFDLTVTQGIYRVEFTGDGFGTFKLLNYPVLNKSLEPLRVVILPVSEPADYDLISDLTPIEDLGTLSVSNDITPRSPATNERRGTGNYKLIGRITDSEGAAISNLQVTAMSGIGETRQTTTDPQGYYQLLLSKGDYVLEIEGVPGFRKTIVSGIRIDGRPVTFDHKLEVDNESPTTLYTDLVCDANGVCKIISRRGDGSTKPQLIILKPLDQQ